MASMNASNKFRHFGAVPVINGTPYLGNLFYVNSSHALASDTTSNGTIDRPFNTIDYAIGRCTANNNDCIIVGVGHTETVIAAAGIACDVAGISIEGLGWGASRPTITFSTATTADIDIDAANVHINNIRFVGAIAALAAPIDVNAAGFQMRNCAFYASIATTDIEDTIVTAAGVDDMLIKKCSFNYITSLAGTAVTATSGECIKLVGTDRARIEDNIIEGDFTVSAISGTDTASTNLQLRRNRVYNIATEDIAGCVDMVAASTGWSTDNRYFCANGVAVANIVDMANMVVAEDYLVNAVAETAINTVGTEST